MTIDGLERILTNPQDMGEVFLFIKEYGPAIYAVLKAAGEWSHEEVGGEPTDPKPPRVPRTPVDMRVFP
jgi:hypothetical protein